MGTHISQARRKSLVVYMLHSSKPVRRKIRCLPEINYTPLFWWLARALIVFKQILLHCISACSSVAKPSLYGPGSHAN